MGGQGNVSPRKKSKKKKKQLRKQSSALKLHFGSLQLSTGSTDASKFFRNNSKHSIIGIHKEETIGNDALQFDDLLGLVNDMEKDHLLQLKQKVASVQQSNDGKQPSKQQYEQIIHDHLKQSPALVRKIKNIKNRKKKRRAKYAKRGKATRYNDRLKRNLFAKSRKKRLRRQSLNAW